MSGDRGLRPGTTPPSSQAPVRGRYPAVLVDPPWRQSNGPLLGGVKEGWAFPDHADGRSQPLPYATMSLEAIKALSVSDLAEPDAHLWLWTTNAYIAQSFDVVRAWGFRFSTLLTWCKTTMGCGLGGDAFGISSEFLLFCRRGKCPAQERITRTYGSSGRAVTTIAESR